MESADQSGEERSYRSDFKKRLFRIVIYENHFGYHNIMMQRPQHMLRNMGDEETLILYNSYYDIDFKDRRRITPIARHVYVLDLYYYRKYLLNALKQIEKKIRHGIFY